MNGSKTTAWIGAILVHIALVAVLFFSVRWKQVAPASEEALTVELVTRVAPPSVAAEPAPPPPPTAPPAPPKPAPAPTALKTPPLPPVPSPADIAREKAQKDVDKKAQLAKLVADEAKANAKLKAVDDASKKDAAKKLDDARAKDVKAAQEKVNKEQQTAKATAAAALATANAGAVAAEKQARELAERQAADRAAKAATDAATARARGKAEGDYVGKIRAKVKGNIPFLEMTGNPEAVFEVVQLPTGEVLTVTLKKPSGNPAYDEAVQRAIQKSSPLPKPDQADVFRRELTLKFRPLE